MIPLLRLPKRALDIVLWNMTTMNQFLLSLYYDHLKSRIKTLTNGLNLSFKMSVSEVLYMYIVGSNCEWLDFGIVESESVSKKEGEPKRSFTENDLVVISYSDADCDYGWRFEAQKSARQWVLLIMEVFSLTKITNLEYVTDDYRFDSVKEVFKGIPLERLMISGNEIASKYQNVLNTISPSLHLMQETDPANSFQNVLIQNFESIDLSFQLNLPDLLITNSKFLKISGENFTIKKLNEFLKLWRKGSNPNAKHFSIPSAPMQEDDDVMNVLNGIPYESVPDTVERSFLKLYSFLPATYTIRGGYDIKRMTDGRKATVKLEHWWRCLSFDFFVWDE
ncbi:unnamed protein product [Caenorhabditis brenneri]